MIKCQVYCDNVNLFFSTLRSRAFSQSQLRFVWIDVSLLFLLISRHGDFQLSLTAEIQNNVKPPLKTPAKVCVFNHLFCEGLEIRIFNLFSISLLIYQYFHYLNLKGMDENTPSSFNQELEVYH